MILGPFLIWVYPNIFLSIRVNNATDISIGIIKHIDFIIIKIFLKYLINLKILSL